MRERRALCECALVRRENRQGRSRTRRTSRSWTPSSRPCPSPSRPPFPALHDRGPAHIREEARPLCKFRAARWVQALAGCHRAALAAGAAPGRRARRRARWPNVRPSREARCTAPKTGDVVTLAARTSAATRAPPSCARSVPAPRPARSTSWGAEPRHLAFRCSLRLPGVFACLPGARGRVPLAPSSFNPTTRRPGALMLQWVSLAPPAEWRAGVGAEAVKGREGLLVAARGTVAEWGMRHANPPSDTLDTTLGGSETTWGYLELAKHSLVSGEAWDLVLLVKLVKELGVGV